MAVKIIKIKLNNEVRKGTTCRICGREASVHTSGKMVCVGLPREPHGVWCNSKELGMFKSWIASEKNETSTIRCKDFKLEVFIPTTNKIEAIYFNTIGLNKKKTAPINGVAYYKMVAEYSNRWSASKVVRYAFKEGYLVKVNGHFISTIEEYNKLTDLLA